MALIPGRVGCRTMCLLLAFFSLAAFGQSVTLHVTVNPPYSPYLSDWLKDNGKVLVTLIPGAGTTRTLSVRLEASLSGSNGIVIASQPGYSGGGPITVTPGMPLVLTTNDIKNVLDPDHLVFTNISKSSIISSDGLPEGMYTLCLRAYDNTTNQPLSNEGCSAPVTIVHPEPPVIVQPQNNDTVKSSAMQHLQFTWTPSAGAPAGITYSLRIVEMIPSARDPQDALSSTYSFFNAPPVPTSSQMVGPSDPLLVPGHHYAAVVTATDPLNRVVFKNRGVSDPVVFVYGDTQAVASQPPAAGTKTTKESAQALSQFALSYMMQYNMSMHGTISYQFASLDVQLAAYTQRFPLAGMPVALVERYVWHSPTGDVFVEPKVSITNYAGTGPQINIFASPEGNHAVLATAVTDDKGNFSFQFMSKDTFGLFNFAIPNGNGGGTVPLTRVACVMVQSSYYCSPLVKLVPVKDIDNNAGDLTAVARSYSLTVKVMPSAANAKQQITQDALGGVKVYLLRKNRPLDVPANEGSPAPSQPHSLFQSEVIAEGVTSSAGADKGCITFSHLIKNIGPNDNYVLYAETDTTHTNRYSGTPTTFQFCPTDTAVFDNEYVYPTTVSTFHMDPLPPRIFGFVYRGDATQTLVPVQNANVGLIEVAQTVQKNVASQLASAAGGYVFDNLPPQCDAAGIPNGYFYKVKGSKTGFRDSISPPLPSLLLGMQVPQSLFLQPADTVTGTVVDEHGQGVSATVQIGDGALVHADAPMVVTNAHAGGGYHGAVSISYAPAPYASLAATGSHQRVIVDPDLSQYYFPETLYVDITKNGQVLNPVTVYEKKHRLRIHVLVGSSKASKSAKPLANAQVKIGSMDSSFITNEDGFVSCSFFSAGDNFQINVSGPDNADYLPTVLNASVPASMTETPVAVYITRAAHVSGKVLLNRRIAVAGARVFIDGVSTQTFTDNSGAYILHNVPIVQGLTVNASKSSTDTTFVGGRTVVTVTDSGAQNADITLTVYNGMDITHLLGFPVEIDTLAESGTSVRIRGALARVPSNNRFSIDTNLRIPFPEIALIPGPVNANHVPTAQPATLPLVTDLNTLPLKMGTLQCNLLNRTAGLQVNVSGTDNAIIGEPNIPGSDFAVSGIVLNGFSVVAPGSQQVKGNPVMPAITASGHDPLPKERLRIVDSTGGDLSYTLLDFKAVALADSSSMNGDTAMLYTTLHSHITGLSQPDINLNIGNVRLSGTQLGAIMGTKPVSLPLDQWTMTATHWSLGAQGLVFDTGAVKAGSLSIPFSGVKITASALKSGSFALDTLRSSTAPPIAISGTVQFGYDANQGHWSLAGWPASGMPAGVMAGLPGCAAQDKLAIANFQLLSNGKKNFFLDNGQKRLTIYNVATFMPQSMSMDSAAVVLGSLDLSMSQVQAKTTSIMFYRKAGGPPAFDFQAFPLSWAVNGVQAEFLGDPANPQTFDSQGFTARGIVKEDGVFSFAVTLKRTLDSIGITIDPGQKLAISKNGGRSLQNTAGGMHVATGAWNDFHFDGDLAGATGATGHLAFIVYGDIVADNQAVGVKNIATPFGGLSLVYEPDRGRMSGHLHFEQEFPGANAQGDAEAVFDDNGWYFLCASAFELSNPDTKGQVAMLIGDYPITPAITSLFEKYSYVYLHKGFLPASFPSSIKGFYFEGMTDLPVQSFIGLPNIDINLGVISAQLWVNAGGDTRMGMQFNAPAKVGCTAGMDNFFEAGMSLGASVVVACGGVSMGAILDQGFDGGINTSGDWFADATGDLTLTGSAFAGWGLCTSRCTGRLCNSDSWSGGETFGMQGHIGSDGKYIRFYVKKTK